MEAHGDFHNPCNPRKSWESRRDIVLNLLASLSRYMHLKKAVSCKGVGRLRSAPIDARAGGKAAHHSEARCFAIGDDVRDDLALGFSLSGFASLLRPQI